MAATNDLVKMVRLMAVTELLKTCRGEDGAFDPALVKAYVRSAYRKTAFAAHPDNNAQRPELHPYFREAAEVWAFVDEGASNEELVRWAKDYEKDSQGTDSATEGMLRAAAEMIEELQFERDDLQTRLTQVHASLVGVQRGQRRFTPDMVVVYSDPQRSVRITLANAATEIPRLIAGRPDPALEQRLRDAERTLQDVRAEVQRTQTYANEQNRLVQEWQTQARQSQQQASAEASKKRQTQERLDALADRYKAALETLRQETTAREAHQRQTKILEQTLTETQEAADALVRRTIVQHAAELERVRGAAHQQLEDARRNPISTKIVERIKQARNTRQYEKALQLCELLLDAEPGNTHALYFQGTTLEALGRHEEAGRSYFKLTTLAPGHSSGKAAYTRIEQRILIEIKTTREARAYEASLAAAVSLLRVNPTHPHALYFAGANAAQLGRKDEARAYLEQLPNHTSAKAILGQLI